MEGKILCHGLKGFRQTLSEGGMYVSSKLQKHFSMFYPKGGKLNKERHWSSDTAYADLARLPVCTSLHLFITLFTRQLPLTTSGVAALYGHGPFIWTWAAPSLAQRTRQSMHGISPCTVLAELLLSESLGSVQSLQGHLNLSDPLMKFLKGLHKSSSLRIS